jgi:lipopolysaccharide biosynthesis regulator YciM
VSKQQNAATPVITLKQHSDVRPSEKIDVIQNAIEETLKNKPELFAKVHLLDIHVEDGNVAINLSHDFLQLNTLGDTGESMAQNALCDALNRFPSVRKLTVMVDGSIYQGEHYGEWKDIPIRAANDINGGDR